MNLLLRRSLLLLLLLLTLVEVDQFGDGHSCRTAAAQYGSTGRSRVHLKPRMLGHSLQGRPLIGRHPQALPNEVHAFGRQSNPEAHVSPANLFVCFKGNVSADHVVQQNAQAPNCRLFAVVATLSDPFGRGVNSCTCNIETTSYNMRQI